MLWAINGTRPSDLELREVADGVVNSHLSEAQSKFLAALKSANRGGIKVEGVAASARGGKEKLPRHSRHRTPVPAQQARWDPEQQVGDRGPSLRAIACERGMSQVPAIKYASVERPLIKVLSDKEQAKTEALAQSLEATH